MHIIYVDDEKFSRLRFKEQVKAVPSVNSCDFFEDAAAALEYCKDSRVDLAFIDIVMPQNDGLWLASHLKNLGIPFVFVTSFNNYAKEAFAVSAVHYLVKPLLGTHIADAVTRIQSAPANTTVSDNTVDKPTEKTIDRIFIKNRAKLEAVELTTVLFISGSGVYSKIHKDSGATLVAPKLLKSYADMLRGHPDFVRIHRSYLINKRHIKYLTRNEGGGYNVVLSDLTELRIAPSLNNRILELLA